MTRYFFDILAGGEIVADEEAMNLPDLQAAVREATYFLADLARHPVRSEDFQRLAISVRTLDGPCSKQLLHGVEPCCCIEAASPCSPCVLRNSSGGSSQSA